MATPAPAIVPVAPSLHTGLYPAGRVEVAYLRGADAISLADAIGVSLYVETGLGMVTVDIAKARRKLARGAEVAIPVSCSIPTT